MLGLVVALLRNVEIAIQPYKLPGICRQEADLMIVRDTLTEQI